MSTPITMAGTFTVRNGRQLELFEVVFTYDPADPYAITMLFPGLSQWLFSRDLLLAGMHSTAGHDRVIVTGRLADVHITISYDGVTATVHVPRRRLTRFLDRTLDAVPLGSEHADVDGWITRMLPRGAR